MTTTATLTVESIESQLESLRKACAYLKGYIVGYAVKQGMKWSGDPERTEEFKQGWDDSSWVNPTFAHIIYNRIRHDRSHLGSREADQACLDDYWGSTKSKLLAKLAEFGIDVREVTA